MKAIVYSFIFALLLVACSTPKSSDNRSFLAFTGAIIIDGSGGQPIENGVLLIANGRVAAVGPKTDIKIPEQAEIVDMQGKTIIPGLINAHGHVGDVKGIQSGHYSRQNVIDNLGIFARYGVTTVVSLGADQEAAVPLRAVNDTTATQRARLYIAGEVISGSSPEEAISVVGRNDSMTVDFMKIRVDNNLGSTPKMSEEIYQAVINQSHELGYKIATHMYYLDDAKKLLNAGSDFLAHSIRDLPVDQELVDLLKENEVCYCPTLTRELSTFVYEDTASFFSDPFFLNEFDKSTIAPLLDPDRQQQVKNSRSAQIYKEHLPTAMANLKTLSDNGVTIAFGTDSGIPTRFMGYFEHLEMEMMADAGMTPMQIIVSATKDAAACLELKNIGQLAPGYWADFVVLDASPLEDIKNTRSISSVWIGGVEVK